MFETEKTNPSILFTPQMSAKVRSNTEAKNSIRVCFEWMTEAQVHALPSVALPGKLTGSCSEVEPPGFKPAEISCLAFAMPQFWPHRLVL